MVKVTLRLKGKECPVYIGARLEDLGSRVQGDSPGQKVLILSDERVASLYAGRLTGSLKRSGLKAKLVTFKPGERSKTLATVNKIIRECSFFGLERTDTVLGLGGGVTGDLAGFVASIYLRGVNYVSVPTSFLAQVDAAVGGKTGVDLPWGKNLIGTFYQPWLIWMDLSTLATLPARQVRQGLAEVIKYGVINDAELFSFLEKIAAEKLPEEFAFLVERSVRIKGKIVEADEREETGLREILNFGHTIGHGIEMACLPEYTHGEAVSLGMVGETWLAVRKGVADQELLERLVLILKKYGLPWDISVVSVENVLNFMKFDKKIRRGRWRFVLPRRLGLAEAGIEIKPAEIRKTWREFARRYPR
ncbi:MAG TPA: 3-dehydroquinate synthase [bacterium]|nr:3-dehydroquinate synthase [bacterium]